MFEDLILAFYLLITIIQRFFLRMHLHILWWKYLMLRINILCKQPLSSARIKSSNIVFIRHKLSLSCSICSSKAIIILALNSPLREKREGCPSCLSVCLSCLFFRLSLRWSIPYQEKSNTSNGIRLRATCCLVS